MLKKRSGGPALGKPSQRSFEMFHLASYDIDGFRAFVASPGFEELFELDPALKIEIFRSDEKLLQFACRFLRQALFGEITIKVRREAAERRRARLKQRLQQLEDEAARKRLEDQDRMYEDLA